MSKRARPEESAMQKDPMACVIVRGKTNKRIHALIYVSIKYLKEEDYVSESVGRKTEENPINPFSLEGVEYVIEREVVRALPDCGLSILYARINSTYKSLAKALRREMRFVEYDDEIEHPSTAFPEDLNVTHLYTMICKHAMEK